MQQNPGPDNKSPDPLTTIPLYRSPRINPENNAVENSGTDLFARRAPDGTVSCYLRDWSGSAGETTACTPVTEDFAVRFIREMVTGLNLEKKPSGFFDRELCCTGEAVAGLEHDNLAEYLPGLCRAAEKKPGNGR